MFNNTQEKIELNKQFEDAVLQGNIDKVRELFAENKSEDQIPYIDIEFQAAPGIMVAAQQGNWEMVEELYNLGADLDVKVMPQKWYLINECISNAPERVTKAIISYSNVNVQNNKGETPLMIAIKRQKGFMAEFLLETDRVDLSLVNDNLENAAHYAAREKNHELFLSLIAKGVPLLRKNKEGKTPIDLIEDEAFRLSLPIELEKIAESGSNIVLEDAKKEEQEVSQEQVKKVTGLSSIKKKIK